MNRSRITGLALASLGIFLLIMAGGIPDPELEDDVGPRLFPYIAGIGLAVCGTAIFLRTGKRDEKAYLSREGWTRLLYMAGLMLLYTFGLLTAGFLISTPVILYIAMRLMGVKSKEVVKTVGLSVVLTLVVYVVFERLLHVMLPPGMII